jgi:hypothetical protein
MTAEERKRISDGTKLAISVTPTASADDSFMKQQVMVVDAKTGNLVSTIENKGKLGQQLAFVL